MSQEKRFRWLPAVAIYTLLLLSPGIVGAQTGEAPRDLGGLLEQKRKEFGLPGIAAAVVRGNQIVAEGVAGVREVGKADKLALDDRFMIGSCSKIMTARMLGRLADAGKLALDGKLGELLLDVPMREEYRDVKLIQLLNFRGGIQPYTRIGPRVTPFLFELKGTLPARREQFVRHVLMEEPIVKPGTEERYSNASYAVAVFVAAHLTKREFEDLIREQIFAPLAMKHSGFGRPRDLEHPDEPKPHVKQGSVYTPEPPIDRQVEGILAGAGHINCSIRDLAKFAAYDLAGARGNDPLLKHATADRLQPELKAERAADRVEFGGAPWLTAGYMLMPGKNVAMVAAVNGGGAEKACEAFFEAVKKGRIGFEP
jgi:CubicO group peptidase (beta-lactamase class C family)